MVLALEQEVLTLKDATKQDIQVLRQIVLTTKQIVLI